MGKTENKSHKTLIIVALIGSLAVLGTVLFINWDKTSSPFEPSASEGEFSPQPDLDEEKYPEILIPPETGEEHTLSKTDVPIDEGPIYTPYDNPPRPIRGTIDVVYPEQLEKAGIEGRVILWLHIDEAGKVDKALVNISSGNSALDDAAVRAMRKAEFAPALQRHTPVPVWIQYPVTFRLPRHYKNIRRFQFGFNTP